MKNLLLAATAVLLITGTSHAEAPKIKKEKLQIVFLFGQSNMVGLADIKTAQYALEPQYVPPKEYCLQRSEIMEWGTLFWDGLRTFKGPQKLKDQLDALYDERRDSRSKWRQRIKGVGGVEWNEKEWGKKPEKGRTNVYAFLDEKAIEEGIYKRMADIIGSTDNAFPPEVAYQEIIDREAMNADDVKRIREIYLKNADAESFTKLAEAMKEANVNTRTKGEEAAAQRALIAKLAKEHVGLPISERTYIYAHGHNSGVEEGSKNENTSHGPLTVGYGGGISTIGPEYGVGITLERMVDAPILLVKCAWGNTALSGAWRPPSMDGKETPQEKANREAWNDVMAARAKENGTEYKPKGPPEKTDELAYCWGMTLPQIDKVLADPGKYHPDYDPKVGYEVAGLVWFQGYSDMNNSAYGELLVEMIQYMRDKVKAPKMPVVCGALGMPAYKHLAFSGDVNGGMVQAAQHPDLKGSVDVVNTARYFPVELGFAQSYRKSLTDKESPAYKEVDAVIKRAVSNKGFHYEGSAKCFLLMGDAMGRSLVNLMNDGEPTILEK